jgi:hypothetical protein
LKGYADGDGNKACDRREQRPPVFTAWLAIRYRGAVCERWNTFPNFYADVGPRPSWRRLLIRDDTLSRAMPDGELWRDTTLKEV